MLRVALDDGYTYEFHFYYAAHLPKRRKTVFGSHNIRHDRHVETHCKVSRIQKSGKPRFLAVSEGKSKHNPSDQFSKGVGRRVALSRAIRNCLGVIPLTRVGAEDVDATPFNGFSKDQRAKIWEAYFAAHNDKVGTVVDVVA
jgi:hypothetical protein